MPVHLVCRGAGDFSSLESLYEFFVVLNAARCCVILVSAYCVSCSRTLVFGVTTCL